MPASSTSRSSIGTFSEQLGARRRRPQSGDRIVAVDGKPVENWEQFSMAIVAKAKREVTSASCATASAAQITVVPVGAGQVSSSGDLGIQPIVHPADRRGQQGPAGRGSRTQAATSSSAAGGRDDQSTTQLLGERSRRTRDKPLTLDVKRGGRTQDMIVTPRPIGDKVMIGAQFSFLETVHGRSPARSRR